MERILCPSCETQGFCQLKEAIDIQIKNISKDFPPEMVSREIEDLRVEARKLGCPNVNYDPPYPGRERL